MYKCTECGQEYNNKPDYCDCGNDSFEIIEPQQTESKVTESTAAEHIEANEPKTIQKHQKPTYKNPFDPISLTIFSICIILSVLSIIFIGRDSQDHTFEEKTKRETSKKMPSIDSIWTATKIKTSQVEQNKKQETVVEQQQKPKPPKIKSQPAAKPTAKPSVKPATPTQTKKTQTLTPAKPAAPSVTKPAVNSAAAQQELTKYKIELRNKIASDINFAAVVGDGKCTVSFKLDSSGNLINRAFVKQSDNDSLNDMVYGAMMQNPTFRTPPYAYKNETLKITVKMYGGNYEVNLY